jgi:hypothetical protein
LPSQHTAAEPSSAGFTQQLAAPAAVFTRMNFVGEEIKYRHAVYVTTKTIATALPGATIRTRTSSNLKLEAIGGVCITHPNTQYASQLATSKRLRALWRLTCGNSRKHAVRNYEYTGANILAWTKVDVSL